MPPSASRVYPSRVLPATAQTSARRRLGGGDERLVAISEHLVSVVAELGVAGRERPHSGLRGESALVLDPLDSWPAAGLVALKAIPDGVRAVQ